MNKKRREALRTVIKELEECNEAIESISDDEQDCLENTPENLKESDRYYAMEDAVDSLEDATDQIGYAIEHIESACGG